MVGVLLFGRLRDVAGWRERSFEPTPATVSALIAMLTAEDPALGEALAGKGVRFSIDKALGSGDLALEGGMEIAFLPPMSGG
jgi:molybdopterin synthase sulfur carrier subunit